MFPKYIHPESIRKKEKCYCRSKAINYYKMNKNFDIKTLFH